jgi:ligand-binding sensor domain-containing protein
VRFDGVRFVPWVPIEGTTLLSSTSIYSLLAATDGSLWIGTGVNLFRFKDGNLTSYTNALGHFNSILEDRNGSIWTARSRAVDGAGPLCQVTGTTLRCYGKADGIPFLYGDALVGDGQENLWIAGESELARWSRGSSTTYPVQSL